jgi:hypothetical protein
VLNYTGIYIFILYKSIGFVKPTAFTMKIRQIFFTAFAASALFFSIPAMAQAETSSQTTDSSVIPAHEKLVVLWTSGDRDVALKMVFMYTYNAKTRGWWDDITLVVWGPSAKLLSEDEELQVYMKKILDAGVTVKACKGCADQYGVSDQLEELGITVLYIGKELTDYMKEGREMLTI